MDSRIPLIQTQPQSRGAPYYGALRSRWRVVSIVALSVLGCFCLSLSSTLSGDQKSYLTTVVASRIPTRHSLQRSNNPLGPRQQRVPRSSLGVPLERRSSVAVHAKSIDINPQMSRSMDDAPERGAKTNPQPRDTLVGVLEDLEAEVKNLRKTKTQVDPETPSNWFSVMLVSSLLGVGAFFLKSASTALAAQAVTMSPGVDEGPKVQYRNDYTPTPFTITDVELTVDLDAKETQVVCISHFERVVQGVDLVLDGEMRPANMQLICIRIGNGDPLDSSKYVLRPNSLTIPADVLPAEDTFTLTIITTMCPNSNTNLSGLYESEGILCTQMEADGFRNMTYFYDRPDVMATYTTAMIGDKATYPVLLSNGNPVDAGDLPHGKHFVRWRDPWPKPCYLFAMVAGDLACVEDTFITCSGKTVQLRIFVEHGNEDQTAHALLSLQKAMKWDEEEYGREYDLDQFNIVAVRDFNMGAMENKSLNIFNSQYVLGNPATATDADYARIEGVIAHEYFHNWTGNRVTCRDWFQLTLKEGLTVFRDQSFSADMCSRVVQRIQDVNTLRSVQFSEDAGPLAHPIRPDSYMTINNIYTSTVYNKGAEIVRMLATILGKRRFRKGMDLYFDRHDAQAVTCEDFVAAMEDANGKDFTQFRLWYSRSGTPEVDVKTEWDEDKGTYSMTFTQKGLTQTDAGDEITHTTKLAPLDIPIAVGLIGTESLDPIPLVLQVEGEDEVLEVGAKDEEVKEIKHKGTKVLRVNEEQVTFTFQDVWEPVVPSFLRKFSAPIKLTYKERTPEHLHFLMMHDTDMFNRWEAGQQLAATLLVDLARGRDPDLSVMLTAFWSILEESEHADDMAFQSKELSLPGEQYLGDLMPQGSMDVTIIHEKREQLRLLLANELRQQFWSLYKRTRKGSKTTGQAAGRRALKNVALEYLCVSLQQCDDDEWRDQVVSAAVEQFESADNMTDQLGALQAVVHYLPKGSEWVQELQSRLLASYYDQWKDQPLVLNKWFGIQATAPGATVEDIRNLIQHDDFDITNPNMVYATVGGFASVPINFHGETFEDAYQFLAEMVIRLDSLNPQVAAMIAAPFAQCKRIAPLAKAEAMKEAMSVILAAEGLSPNVFEVVSKSRLCLDQEECEL